MTVFKKIIIGTLITIVLWIAGCSAGLPVIPFVETDYFVSEYNKPLADGHTVTKTDNETTKIEIPNYYADNGQCLDFWFTSSNGKHILTVENFKMTVMDENGDEIKRLNSYLFWDDGSEDEKFGINNYEIEKTGSQDQDKYVFFRTVVDLSGESNFAITIKADYYVDSVQRQIDKTFDLAKRKKLTWNEFRVH
jgi:hypothetical protein